MRNLTWRYLCTSGCAGLALLGGSVAGQVAGAQDATSTPAAAPAPQAATASSDASTNPNPGTNPPKGAVPLTPDLRKQMDAQGDRIDAMRSQIAAQMQQLDDMRKALAQQEQDYRSLRKAVGLDVLDKQRAGSVAAGGANASAMPMPAGDAVAAAAPQDASQPVGQAPPKDNRPPEVAPIFDQPGVLTPKNKLIIEPSYQFGYSALDRVALIGYTVIPAILIGLIDARQVKTTVQTATLAARYGITNRLEFEIRVPYVWANTDTISREIFTGSATDRVFTTSGHDIGDIEATARYQINDGGPDKAYYIGWLRFKSRTGRDPFEVTTDCVQRCEENATGTGLPLQSPTGTGFYSLQPGVTWLYPSDPVVFFGNVSYLYNFARNNVSRNLVLSGTEFLGKVKAGNIVDVSVGMGLALNEKASISIGYDQSWVGAVKQNNQTVPGSTKLVQGTLLLGGSWRFNEKRTLNFTLGVGVTRDTPDATVTVRVPMMY